MAQNSSTCYDAAMSDRHPRRRSRLGLIMDFLILADVFVFAIIFAMTANIRLALVVPAIFDLGVLALGTTRATRILVVATLVPLGIVLSLFGLPWGWFIAVLGLLLSLTFVGDKKVKNMK